MDLLNKEEIALEWFWNKKKDEKKIERKIQPKEYLQKAKSTLQSLLNKPEFKDLKKYIRIKVDSNGANEFSEGKSKYCSIGEYFNNTKTEDEQIKIAELEGDLTQKVVETLGDESYDIYPEGSTKDGNITVESLMKG